MCLMVQVSHLHNAQAMQRSIYVALPVSMSAYGVRIDESVRFGFAVGMFGDAQVQSIAPDSSHPHQRCGQTAGFCDRRVREMQSLAQVFVLCRK